MLVETVTIARKIGKEFPWNAGYPPHTGWWYTLAAHLAPTELSALHNLGVWRWWDGKVWSQVSSILNTPVQAAERASVPTKSSISFWWCHYWPTDARVPRLDTEGFKTFADGEVLTLAPEQDMFHRCCKCGSVHKLTIRAVSRKDSSILPVPITISAKRYV